MSDPVPSPVDPTTAAILANLRQVLLAVGTLMAAHGLIGPNGTITPGRWDFITGILVALAPVAYTWYQHIRDAKNAKAREAVAVQAGIALVTQGAALAVDGSKIATSNIAPPVPVTVKSAEQIIANVGPSTVAKG